MLLLTRFPAAEIESQPVGELVLNFHQALCQLMVPTLSGLHTILPLVTHLRHTKAPKMVREADFGQAAVQRCTGLSRSAPHRLPAGFSTVCSSGEKTIDKLKNFPKRVSENSKKLCLLLCCIKNRLWRPFSMLYLPFPKQFLSSCSRFTRLHI